MAPFGFTPKARHNRGVALRSTYRLDGWVMGPVDKEGWGLSYVFAQPSVLAAAATDLAGIGSAINQATAAVAAPTTGLAAAAADEVSTALATLFGAYGQQFQAISAQVAAFHNEFTQRLAAATNAFVNAEATNTSALVQEATAGLFKPTSPPVLPPMFNQNTAIIMGGTGSPIPTPSYVNAITTLFIDPVVSNPVVKALVTPEELYPITGVKSLPFQTSVQLGLQILDGAIWEQINAGNHVTVFGYSQSAVIASLEMQHLISLGPNAPSPSQLNFILIGNEMNPNGGILARIPGLNVTTLGYRSKRGDPGQSLSDDDLHPRVRRFRRLPAVSTQCPVRYQRSIRDTHGAHHVCGPHTGTDSVGHAVADTGHDVEHVLHH